MTKRFTQLLASILFIISVLTVFLAFDFAVNNASSNKNLVNKHQHIHDDNKIRKKSTISSLLNVKQLDLKSKHNHDNANDQIIDHEHRTRSTKRIKHPAKSAQFHKSKTGVKINQIKQSDKNQRKSSFTTKIIQRKEIKDKIE